MIREPFVMYNSDQGFNTSLEKCADWLDKPQVDVLTEYAGRVCYKSDDRMFNSASYIKARMDEGHEDIAEHPWISIALGNDLLGNYLNKRPKHMNLLAGTDARRPDTTILGGTARTWMQFLRDESHPADDIGIRTIASIKAILLAQGPSMFHKYGDEISEYVKYRGLYHDNFTEGAALCASGAIVKMVYRSKNLGGINDKLASATFELNHVTRALTHQLVRHRGLSFSQESQRYVDMSKSAQGYAGPLLDYLDEDTADSVDDMLEAHWWALSGLYEKLRSMGVHKEDARCIMPNMAGTRIVVSGSLEYLRHFLWLRCPKDAQREIRDVARNMLAMLNNQFPGSFTKEMEHFHV